MSIREAKKLAKIYPLIVRVPKGWFESQHDLLNTMSQLGDDLRTQFGTHYRLFVIQEDRTDLEFVSLFNGKGYHETMRKFSNELRQKVGKHLSDELRQNIGKHP